MLPRSLPVTIGSMKDIDRSSRVGAQPTWRKLEILGNTLLAVGLLTIAVYSFVIAEFFSSGGLVGLEEPSTQSRILGGMFFSAMFWAGVAGAAALVWITLLLKGVAERFGQREAFVVSVAGGASLASGSLVALTLSVRLADEFHTRFPADPIEAGLLVGFFSCSAATAVLNAAIRRRDRLSIRHQPKAATGA